LRAHIEGLCQLQDKTGFWHQLLDRPDTYLETSCTAIYCYCIAHAISRGWVDAQAYGSNVLLAWNAVATKVNSLGQVEGTCVGTGMGFDPAFYAYRPVSTVAAHG
jgi:rhamnogalacturonyl hydrolase YesR